ncbi:hypothetical protein CABS01_12727 [Colletotrichum abscissum]|uniref:Uncharacterized protein n=1 Tax=Colletotrichum abscissum TaxID=1671311 RepID=A0A9P9X2V6_9PEZI|nr:uncharacterized protein CABS01_12727 [Colletotrichum abscissum]KAI3533712.1 hypothetical protein CABS02_13466 [Colletotrichum abscissum]KAK1489576.1 hypothetical protein CABS01_12727 [Colletotrichum abscissum]
MKGELAVDAATAPMGPKAMKRYFRESNQPSTLTIERVMCTAGPIDAHKYTRPRAPATTATAPLLQSPIFPPEELLAFIGSRPGALSITPRVFNDSAALMV